MNAYVSDWSQELYGDIRNYAVPGADVTTRRDELNAWLQHPLALANAGPPEIARREGLPAECVQPARERRVALPDGRRVRLDGRAVRADAGLRVGADVRARLGRRSFRLRLVAEPARRRGHHAVRDGEQRRRGPARGCDSRPGVGVRGVVHERDPGATFNEGWKDFANWATPTLAFGNAPATLTAGAASAALTVRLQVAGITRPDTVPVTVSLSSDSPDGTFSTSAERPVERDARRPRAGRIDGRGLLLPRHEGRCRDDRR